MNVHTLPSTPRIQPSQPVEIRVSVDGEALSVLIEWGVIERWLGEFANDPEAVKRALHSRRSEIERVVQARVFAHGMPISGELALSVRDFPRR
ncbi:MAG: hypothetical protein IT518_19435 [Burkholderiales bacterium]|nr:hypothetical protein [Burkholderiales bacterium]